MLDRLENDLSTLRTALNLRGYRQEVLASNIANADTPNFKARDIDFKTALQNAMGGKQDGPLPMQQTAAGHLPGADAATPGALKYRTEYQGAVDGNTVNMDIERAEFSDNAMQMDALLTFVRSRFTDIRSAMSNQ